MPLEKGLRDNVTSYIFNHIVPKSVSPRPQKAIIWFEEQFDFIEEERLKKTIGEAFYQARFMGRIIEALGLKGGFNNGLVKAQMVLYASIYEAVIDYGLNSRSNLEAVKKLKADRLYKAHKTALSSNVKLILCENNESSELVVCKETQRERSLKEIQFKQRLKTAIEIDMVNSDQCDLIEKLYDDRNSVHLHAAVAKHFRPDSGDSTNAYKNLFSFIEHARKWFNDYPKNS